MNLESGKVPPGTLPLKKGYMIPVRYHLSLHLHFHLAISLYYSNILSPNDPTIHQHYQPTILLSYHYTILPLYSITSTISNHQAILFHTTQTSDNYCTLNLLKIRLSYQLHKTTIVVSSHPIPPNHQPIIPLSYH